MPETTLNATRQTIIRAALRLVGQPRPSTDEEQNAGLTLNALLKLWDGDGDWAWTMSATPAILTLVAGQESYTAGLNGPPTELSSNIFRLVRVERWRGGKPDYPIAIRTQEQWIASRLRKETGEPMECYLEKAPREIDNRLYFAPVPAAADEIRYYFRRRIFNMDNPSDLPDLTEEWFLTMKFGLAAQLAPEYGLALDRQLKLENDAATYLRKMKAQGEINNASPTNAKVSFF